MNDKSPESDEDNDIPEHLNLTPAQRELWKKVIDEEIVWPGGGASSGRDLTILKSLLESSKIHFPRNDGLIKELKLFHPDQPGEYISIDEFGEVTPEQWEKLRTWARLEEPQSHSFKVGDGKTTFIQGEPLRSPEGDSFSNDLVDAFKMASLALSQFITSTADLSGLQTIADQVAHIAAGVEEGSKDKARQRSREDLKKKRQQMRQRKGKR